jgi:hypothetical protein
MREKEGRERRSVETFNCDIARKTVPILILLHLEVGTGQPNSLHCIPNEDENDSTADDRTLSGKLDGLALQIEVSRNRTSLLFVRELE